MRDFNKNKVNRRILPHSEALYSCSAVAGPFLLDGKNEYETTIDIYNILSANKMGDNPFLKKSFYPTSTICLKKQHNAIKLYDYNKGVFENTTTTVNENVKIENVINNNFKIL